MPPSSLRLGTLSSASIIGQSECKTAEEKQQIAENYQRLKAKLRLIEDELIAQLNELKTICLEEAVGFTFNMLILFDLANNWQNAQRSLYDIVARREIASSNQACWNRIQTRRSTDRKFKWGKFMKIEQIC